MAKPEQIAEMVAKKVQALLEPLVIEMAIRKWPDDLRKIMWDAVSHQASLNAQEDQK